MFGRNSTPEPPVKNDIVKRIEKMVKGQYQKWSIGITNHPEASKKYYEHPITWWQWPVEESKDAKKICQYFKQLGMKNVENHKDEAQYLYIF
jgi:hypothetical protein